MWYHVIFHLFFFCCLKIEINHGNCFEYKADPIYFLWQIFLNGQSVKSFVEEVFLNSAMKYNHTVCQEITFVIRYYKSTVYSACPYLHTDKFQSLNICFINKCNISNKNSCFWIHDKCVLLFYKSETLPAAWRPALTRFNSHLFPIPHAKISEKVHRVLAWQTDNSAPRATFKSAGDAVNHNTVLGAIYFKWCQPWVGLF